MNVSTQASVWHFRIERQARRNAIDSPTATNLSYMLREGDADERCAVAILYGQGEWFCAGSDLKELAGQPPARMAEIEETKAELARTIQEIDLPVIAAVRGFALGGGVALAAACDHVISDVGARWHMPEVANGWLPPWGLAAVIARCGVGGTRNVLWAGSAMSADEARRLGLVDTVCIDGQALVAAEALAAQWAGLPGESRRSVKRYLREQHAAAPAFADAAASALFQSHCASPPALATLSRFGAKA